MKATLKNRIFVLLAAVSMLAVSCTKEDDNFVPSLPVESQPALIGNILDLGQVDDNSRLMVLTLEKHGNLFDLAGGFAIGTGEQITLYVLTDADGHIPSGVYTFTDEETSLPFTFKSGEVLVKYSDAGKSSKIHLVSGGTITVDYDGNHYAVYFSLQLGPGNHFEGTARGGLDYADFY